MNRRYIFTYDYIWHYQIIDTSVQPAKIVAKLDDKDLCITIISLLNALDKDRVKSIVDNLTEGRQGG